MTDHPQTLGRLIPPDRRHEELYPLTALPENLQPVNDPVDMGTNWYESMFKPEKGTDGVWRLRATNLGSIAGGHSYVLQPAKTPGWPGGERDLISWWTFYDQKREGACTGFAAARLMSLLFRKKFDAFWLYDDARRLDGTYPNGEGSYVRSALKALVQWGAHPDRGEVVIEREPNPEGPPQKISAYRWISSVDEIVATLGYPPTVTEVPLDNSWGRNGYQHQVRMPLELLERLLSEEGEAGCATVQ